MKPDSDRYLEERRLELAHDLSSVVADPKLLDAFRSVPRHSFVPEPFRDLAYRDRPLPLIHGQTISQPSMIAIMFEALRPEPESRALEIGAGSGYAAALLSRLVREVHAIELLPELAAMAELALMRTGIDNVSIHVGDGSLGLPRYAPFDRILVSAGAHHVPIELLNELAPSGRIVIPVDDRDGQVLRVGQRQGSSNDIEWEKSVPCVFVPLVQK